MTKKKELIEENQGFTCQNPSCGRTFSTPLRATNLGLRQSEPYLACPYCLAEVNSEEPSALIESKPKQGTRKSKEQTVRVIEEKIMEPTPKTRCGHHFGYLSERSKQDQIPEECMVCENILNCMLKNLKY